MSEQVYGLTKEFWNEMQEKHPTATQRFLSWIDEYKKRVNWNTLFCTSDNSVMRSVKFHHLPIEMQWGIIRLFVFEQFGKHFTDITFSASKIEIERMISSFEK